MLQVIMHDDVKPEKAKQLFSILQKQGFVSKVSYMSKEDALQKFIKEKGEDPMTFLDQNPLYISIDMNLQPQYVQQDSIEKIKRFVTQSNIVREVVYDQTVVGSLDKNFRRAAIILGIVAIILFVAVVFIIDNTVRLAMFSNRHLIKTMQMVGATRWFIARPFNKRALITGLVSSLLAIAGIFLLIYTAERSVPELGSLRNTLSIGILVVGILLLGVLISVFSTYRSVIKYLKMKVDELY